MQMKKIVPAIAATAAAALLVIGCGSSNSPQTLYDVAESNTTATIAGSDTEYNLVIIGKDTNGEDTPMGTITIAAGTEITNATTGETTCTTADPCNLTATEISAGSGLTTACGTSEWQTLISEIELGENEIALYAGELNVVEDSDLILSNCNASYNLKAPYTGIWQDDNCPTREVYGIPGCVEMKLWVTDACGNNGHWVDSEIVTLCDGSRQFNITLDEIPVHIVMFAIMNTVEDAGNLVCTPTGATGGTGSGSTGGEG